MRTRRKLLLLATVLLHGADAFLSPLKYQSRQILGKNCRSINNGHASLAGRRSRLSISSLSAALVPASPINIPLPSMGVFGASVGAVTQLCVTTALGAATVISGAIEPSSISALAKVVYNLFLPSFLFCSVIKTVTTYGISPQFLLMPLFAGLQIAVGLFASRFVILPLLGVKPSSECGRELMLCTSFGNPGVLPLLFFDALFRSPYPDPAVVPKLAAFVSFYLMGFTPLFWAVGKQIITGSDGVAKDTDSSGGLLRRLGGRAASFVKPPPVRGALLGLLVAVTPALRAVLVTEAAPLRSVFVALNKFAQAYLPSASLVLAGSLVSGATRAKPSTSKPSLNTQDDAKLRGEVANNGDKPLLGGTATDDGGGGGMKRFIATICVARFLVMPLLAWTLLKTLAAARAFPTISSAPALWFFLLTEFSMPPAQNSVVMFQVVDRPEGATRMARTLLLTYGIAAVPLSILFAVYKTLTGL